MLKQKIKIVLVLVIGFIMYGCSSNEQKSPEQNAKRDAVTIDVDFSQVKAEIQPTMYGIFFEDINFAADGGIYAEMVKNRSFEFSSPMMGWTQPNSDRHSMNDSSGFATIINLGYDKVNTHFLRVESKAKTGYYLQNEGFRGMGVKSGEDYDLTLMAKQVSGNISTVIIQLVDTLGRVVGETKLEPKGETWKNYSASILVNETVEKARLNLRFEGKGIIDVDMISLFPKDTWMGRPQGLRKDLIQLLADLKPGFLRFPGGCIVEGSELSLRYQWKKTIGAIENREILINRWNTEFDHRPAPDYFQSFGLGFFEYFQLSEDLGAEPLPILSCGMACQFNSAELVPMDQLDPYISDALDLIEFANGSISSTWGKIRAQMGHPEPFNMKYIGVGNEQWGPEYIARYKVFEKAIRSKYPEMIIVSTTGPFPEGEYFDYAMEELKELKVDIIDEHYYKNPEWFLENADRYDSYDRSGPKIFAGEYAAQSVAIASPDNKNNWACALSEAAFITGLERNAEVVNLTSYAPLFAHADGWQWTPDLIWFNNLNAYGTANYYVQKMFSNNVGTHVVAMQSDGKDLIGQNGLYATASKDNKTNTIILKIVNVGDEQKVNLNLKGGDFNGVEGQLQVLSSDDMSAINSFENATLISPKGEKITLENDSLALGLIANSLTIIRIPAKLN
jgi:alpha-L-arabinofuranosidase